LIKKAVIVGIIQRIMQMRFDNVNDSLRLNMLKVGKQFHEQFGYFNRAILTLLAFFSNNPQALMQ
jgi:hypothetical protein